MVRVISAHHFTAQDVSTCPPPSCSAVAGNLLLLASPLHQVEVRSLDEPHTTSHTFPTVDLVTAMEHSPVGRYLATLESRDQLTFVRVYLNWWSPEAASQPMRARVPGLTPSLQGGVCLEMVEIGVREGPTCLAICPATGNLLVTTGNKILVYKYSIVTSAKSKYVDFQECLQLSLPFAPTEATIVEDTLAVLCPTHLLAFKVGLVEEGEEKGLRSLSSTYSFSSESECSLEVKEDTTRGGKGGVLRNPQLNNVTARRRADSSSEREMERKEETEGGIKKHPGHLVIGGSSSDEDENRLERVEVALVDREERDIGSLATPRLLEQVLGPQPCPEVTVNALGNWGSGHIAEATTLVQAKLPEKERRHERLHLLRLEPVYWREWRVRRGANNSHPAPHSPLHSAWHSHLMSFSLVAASVHEGYLFHLPGHLRRPGKGVGVARIATYPFTSPVLDLVLEPSVLHALTETGLETYTLRAGYHTVREAEQVDGKTNALPPPTTPICLIGLRPFLGVRGLLLARNYLVLISEPASGEEWTVYSLHLPSHVVLFQDMLQVADMNSGAPHGFLQLVSEAHVVARTWLHRLLWLQVTRPGGQEVTTEEVDEARANYHLSCLRLADHYVRCPARSKHSLALPYYRMSGLSPLEVLARLPLESPLPPGVTAYIECLLLRPVGQEESFLEAKVADRVISILGKHCPNDLVRLVLASPLLRSFKTRQSLEVLQTDLNKWEAGGEHAVAVVLVGGPGAWLSRVPPVQLSTTLLNNHQLLFEPAPKDVGQCFSNLGLELRVHAPVVFVEVCVSLIQANLFSLGQILQLLLQSFMSSVTSPQDSADSAGVLQLFLETYFMELLGEDGEKSLDGDQQQALLTLLRSYLAGLSHPLMGTFMEDCVLPTGPGEMFGPRHQYLDLLIPIDESLEENATLLKLQSLLCSSYCDDLSRATVARYLDEHPGLPSAASLRLLTLPAGREGAALVWREGQGLALGPYCACHADPRVWGEVLQFLLEQENTSTKHESVDSLLMAMAVALPPATLGPLLPPGEQFQSCLAESKKLQQAGRLQEVIVQTGRRLLDSLTL